MPGSHFGVISTQLALCWPVHNIVHSIIKVKMLNCLCKFSCPLFVKYVDVLSPFGQLQGVTLNFIMELSDFHLGCV